jgi:L-fuconolactonase
MEGATVLVSHLGSPGPGWSTSPSVAAFLGLAEHHSHLSVKLSGLHASANPDHDYPYAPLRGWISDLLEAFGPDRLLWGSNFPVALELCSFPQCISAVEELPWSEADRIAVMGGNLERILRAVQSTPN